MNSINPIISFLLLLLISTSSAAFRSTAVHHPKATHRTTLPSRSIVRPQIKGPWGHNALDSFTPRLMMMIPHPSLAAASGLLISSSLGLMADTVVPNIGILVTLVTSAIASNMNLLPTKHALYDLCWSLFLPASLALMLLSDGQQNANNNNNNSTSPGTMQPIRLVGMSFLMGSIGSILGCWTSHALFQNQLSSSAVAAGCLCSSYIGGSVNFFATSRIVGGDASLISSMAAADLFVMALYFVGLTACARWNALNALFKAGTNDQDQEEDGHDDDDDDDDENHSTINANRNTSNDVTNEQSSSRKAASASVFVTLLAWAIVRISNHVEAKVSAYIPGTACAIICAVTFFVKRLLLSTSGTQWDRMQQAAKPLSAWAFQLLFASIGVSANLGQALATGPNCLFFSMWALLVHSCFMFGSTLILRRTCLPLLRLEHILVASNAAIGGPATAAAFCKPLGMSSLTVAATVWGVTGYAVGTGIGVSMTRALLPY